MDFHSLLHDPLCVLYVVAGMPLPLDEFYDHKISEGASEASNRTRFKWSFAADLPPSRLPASSFGNPEGQGFTAPPSTAVGGGNPVRSYGASSAPLGEVRRVLGPSLPPPSLPTSSSSTSGSGSAPKTYAEGEEFIILVFSLLF